LRFVLVFYAFATQPSATKVIAISLQSQRYSRFSLSLSLSISLAFSVHSHTHTHRAYHPKGMLHKVQHAEHQQISI